MTSPVLVTLGFVVLSLLPFGFGALSHVDLHRAFEFSGKRHWDTASGDEQSRYFTFAYRESFYAGCV